MLVKVNLREKKRSKGRKSLYLDYYPSIFMEDNTGATRMYFMMN